jgi:hypothetical protein
MTTSAPPTPTPTEGEQVNRTEYRAETPSPRTGIFATRRERQYVGRQSRAAKGIAASTALIAIFSLALCTAGASAAEPGGECSNQAFRYGPSAALPDCRAYEMVSPIEKNGGDIVTRCNNRCLRTSLMQAAPDGSRLSYSSYQGFGDVKSVLYSNQYMATPGADGWSSHSLNPPWQQTLYTDFISGVEQFYELNIAVKAISEDLSTMVVTNASKPALTPDATEGAPNLYLRHNDSGQYEWITALGDPSEPSPGAGKEVEVQAITPDGEHVVFSINSQLTPDAAPEAGQQHQLYEYSDGELHHVSKLPDDTPVPQSMTSSAGQAYRGGTEHQESRYTKNALSDDGSRITWSTGPTLGAETIYQRVNNAETVPVSQITDHNEVQEVDVVGAAGGAFKLIVFGSEETTPIPWNATAAEVQEALEELSAFEPGWLEVSGSAGGPYTVTWISEYGNYDLPEMEADASELTGTGPEVTVTTIEDGTGPESGGDIYWSATPDGSEVLYSQIEDTDRTLYRTNVDDKTWTRIANDVTGVVGAGDDLSYVYFVSAESLDSGADAGAPNLYAFHEGTTTFIGTLSPIDVGQAGSVLNEEGLPSMGGYSVFPNVPFQHAARVTPDGQGLAFQSVASLTGYDNRDIKNNEPDVEVFVYDAATDQLVCASCNPSGARPDGQYLRNYDNGSEQPFTGGSGSSKARRWTAAFLQTVENQTYYPRDLSDDGNRLFFNAYDGLALDDNNKQQDVYQWEAQGSGSCADAGGCISLISTGESARRSEFVDADASGDDVFFTTRSSLVPQDPGLIDIYNAKVGGGFDAPPPLIAPCEGDACQSLPAVPNDPALASAAYSGPANVHKKARKKRKHHRRHDGKRRQHRKHHKKQKPGSARAQARDTRSATHRNG